MEKTGREYGMEEAVGIQWWCRRMPVGPSLQQAEIAKSVAGGGRLVILISTGCAPSHQILAKSAPPKSA